MYRICVLFQSCTLSDAHIREKRGAELKLCPFSLSEGNADAVMMLTLVLAVCIPCGKSADRDRFKAGAAEPCKLVQDAEEMLVRFRVTTEVMPALRSVFTMNSMWQKNGSLES